MMMMIPNRARAGWMECERRRRRRRRRGEREGSSVLSYYQAAGQHRPLLTIYIPPALHPVPARVHGHRGLPL
jgi:hypothetical protein